MNLYRIAKNNTPPNVLAYYRDDPLEAGIACYCKKMMVVPRPNSMENLVKYLHECAHFFLHAHDKTKPYHLREFEAETWALGKMRTGGLVLRHEFVCESKERIARAVDGDRKNKIRINRQAEEFAQPYLHDPDHSDFIKAMRADEGLTDPR